MADDKSTKDDKDKLVSDALVNDTSAEASQSKEESVSIAPKKKSSKKKSSKSSKSGKPSKSEKSSKKSSKTTTKSSKSKSAGASSRPKEAISANDGDVQQEVESIKEIEPELSAHDIAIAIEKPVEENYSSEIADEDIEKIVAEVENETPKNSVTDNKSIEESKPGLAHQISSREQRIRRAMPYRIISRILSIVALAAFGAFLTRVALTNAIPAKYLWPSIAATAIAGIIIIAISFKRKASLATLSILNIINLVSLVIGIIGFVSVNGVMTFLDQNLGEKTEYTIYNVFVKKDSPYNSLSDVRGKDFHTISDFTDTTKLEEAVNNQVGGFVIYEKTVTDIMKSATKDTMYIGLLSSGTYESALSYAIDNQSSSFGSHDAKNDYEQNLKVIGEIKVAVDKTTRPQTSNLTKQSFVMFISGIDTRSGQMVGTSLSDVNIIMAVNPTTRQILLVAIPRDYYVMLHGTTGLPDKLTHAGALGGINLSMSTIEDLLDIKFDQYLRVNFNAVINLVNAIGGITVNSDVDYDITAWTNKTCVFHPGLNNLDGACALAFARERYAYSSGDRHRGENQEQVIQKIFEKISSDKRTLLNYSNLLNALSGSFETTIKTSDITSFVNMQLDDMRPWTITTYNLDGTTGMALTHSYPGQYLSVMHPDYNTVEAAKIKIHEVLSGTTEQSSPDKSSSDDSDRNAESDSMKVQIR
ncbi:LCP family protein [Candidatus Saccharibacteria bacterium]|nr:LCP family protein [Candidatus Saccharibacteria bacterium]